MHHFQCECQNLIVFVLNHFQRLSKYHIVIDTITYLANTRKQASAHQNYSKYSMTKFSANGYKTMFNQRQQLRNSMEPPFTISTISTVLLQWCVTYRCIAICMLTRVKEDANLILMSEQHQDTSSNFTHCTLVYTNGITCWSVSCNYAAYLVVTKVIGNGSQMTWT